MVAIGARTDPDPADRLETWDRVEAPEVLLVVGDASSPHSSDTALEARLEESFSAAVTLRSDNDADATSGFDAVVIATSVAEATLGSKYGSAGVPVVSLDGATWNEHQLSGDTASWGLEQDLEVVDADHGLAASLVGGEEMTSQSRYMHSIDTAWLGSGAQVVMVDDPGGDAVAFAYERGASLADSSAAPARRAAIGYDRSVGGVYAISDLTDAGWQLFDNAVAWALGDPTATNVDSVEYGYDENSNRTSVTDDTGTDGSSYDERNRLITGPEGDYTWTARGTLSGIDDGGTVSAYAFDGLGRMTAANEGTAVTYTYDSLDRIAARNGSASGFEFNGASINPTSDGDSVYTLTPSGSIFALDTSSSSARVAMLNRHGDLQRITDPTDGTTDAHNLTDPWGAPLASAGDTSDAGFQGDYTDPDTGDVWMGARWYDPDTGTFSSRDTYPGTPDDPKSGNRNLYGEANPNKHWDPTGRLPQEMGVCLSQGGDFAQCERNHAEYLATIAK